MEDKFYIIYADGENAPAVKCPNIEEAEKEARRLARELGKKTFVLEQKSAFEFNEANAPIRSYEDALLYLGRRNIVCIFHEKHAKAMDALYRLITIAEAWNKADDFVPDFSDREQRKWFPWFRYSADASGFAYADANYTASFSVAHSGSRLCFKSKERARQFGEQFISLWNDFLLFNN